MTKKIEQQNNAAEASAEDRNSFEPQAIYFDTSILYDVRFNGHRLEVLRNHANHLEIPMFVPEIVVKELTLERQNEVRECEACVRKFNAIFPSDLYHLDLSGKPTDFVAKGTRILLESLDIHTIALPEDLSLNTLIELAILRVPPFEQGDKGFKDTLVLETVVRDMKRLGLEEALLLSKDRIFQNGSIMSRLKEEGIVLKAFDRVEEAEKCLYALIENQQTEDTKEHNRAALQFFQSNFDQIAAFILLKLDVTVGDSLIRMIGGPPDDLPWGTTLKEVKKTTPLEVTDAHPWKVSDSVEESALDGWLVSVETEFEMRISFYTGSPFSARTVSLAEANDFESTFFNSNLQFQETIKKVKRTVTVEAATKFNGVTFSEMKLLKAWAHLP